MRCSHCGLCCKATEMMLSNADVEQLEKARYRRRDFAQCDKHGFLRLRNRQGYCVFYDEAKRRCRIYKDRPEGCRVYPVVYSEDEGVVLDELCPVKDTVSPGELRRKGLKVTELLQRICDEAAARGRRVT